MPTGGSSRASRLGHAAGNQIVANIVIAGQDAPRGGQSPELGAREPLVILRIGVGEHDIAGDHDQVRRIGGDNLQHLFPIILVEGPRG